VSPVLNSFLEEKSLYKKKSRDTVMSRR